jgi:hypothetical protein
MTCPRSHRATEHQRKNGIFYPCRKKCQYRKLRSLVTVGKTTFLSWIRHWVCTLVTESIFCLSATAYLQRMCCLCGQFTVPWGVLKAKLKEKEENAQVDRKSLLPSINCLNACSYGRRLVLFWLQSRDQRNCTSMYLYNTSTTGIWPWNYDKF